MRISDWSSDVCSSDLPNSASTTSGSTPASSSAAMTHGANGSARRSAATDSGCADGKSAPNTWNSCSIATRSEEHTSELQSLMRISYAVFCLKQKKYKIKQSKHE